jgi:hypothetical protein
MKTLFEKLTPYVAESLKLESKLYPSVTQDLIDELQSINFWTEMTVKNAYLLVRLDQTKRFSIYELTECFKDEN